MSVETVPLEDALDRELDALTKQQLAALRGEAFGSGQRAFVARGDRPALERKRAGHSRGTFQLICRFGRSLRHLVRRT